MTGRAFLVFTVLAATAVSAADPIDTAYDLMDAVSYQDGYALRELLSQDLWSTISTFIDQVRELAVADPALAGDILSSRYRGRITVNDLEILTNEEILGIVMGGMNLQPEDQVESESAQLEGRNATVVLYYFNGGSVSFRMTWENSGWRITDSSLLGVVFQ